MFILKELNAAKCEGLACETNGWVDLAAISEIHCTRLIG